MTHRLIVLYNCMEFHFNSFNGCQFTKRTRNSIANDQREITPKISKAELSFLSITHCLIVRYKCMKFQPNSLNSVLLTEQTQNCIDLHYKGVNLKNTHARFMVLVHDISSQCRVFPDSRLRVSDSQNAAWDSQITILRVLQDSQK